MDVVAYNLKVCSAAKLVAAYVIHICVKCTICRICFLYKHLIIDIYIYILHAAIYTVAAYKLIIVTSNILNISDRKVRLSPYISNFFDSYVNLTGEYSLHICNDLIL